jgi:hypothetical protein
MDLKRPAFGCCIIHLNCLPILTHFHTTQSQPNHMYSQWRTQEFFSGEGVQQIQLRTEDRENGDLGAVAR